MNLDEYKYMTNSVPVNPFGIPIAQTWQQLGSIFSDLNEYKISLFVELGVYFGGLADLLLIRQSIDSDFHYFGVQLDADELRPRIKSKIRVGDVLDPIIVQEVKNLIDNSAGTAMIYCDAGNKPKEMETYTPLLRDGDYIRVHDFPGEVSEKFLDEYQTNFPYMAEIERWKCRELGYSLWRKLG